MISSRVPSVAASTMAARLSASAACRPLSSAAVRKPPRHRLVTVKPESAINRAAAARPTSATRSRHSPMWPSPARRVASIASGRVSRLVVAVFSESRS